MEHLRELDQFIKRSINEQYESLRCKFTLGVSEYEKSTYYGETDLDKKERVINNQEEIKKLQNAKEKYNQLKAKYPKGLPAFERYNSYDDGKNSAELSLLEIVGCEEEIALFEKYADEYQKYKSWETDQNDFASSTRNLNPDKMGCYFYDVDFPCVGPNGKMQQKKYRVWQHFYSSYYQSKSNGIASEDLSTLILRASENQKFLNKIVSYKDFVYDTILSLILKHKEKYNELLVIFGPSGLTVKDAISLNNYHFRYLKEKLTLNNIPYWSELETDNNTLGVARHIIVVELISTNEGLCRFVKEIRNKLINILPLISYISLRKGYDDSEAKQLAINAERKRKEKKEREEAEKKRAVEEVIIKQMELERKQKEKEEKKRQLNALKSCVSSWHIPNRSVIRCYSLYFYYPTTCNWDASEEEWNIRNLIWNFKAKPHKPQSEAIIMLAHKSACQTIIPLFKKVLDFYFGQYANMLTLVCIPASTQKVTERRYKDFSEELCRLTGMINAYSHVNIIKDGISKNDPNNTSGHSIPVEVNLDSNFFQNKYVILFDDVITTGASVERFKNKIENVGATVIAALSVGKTKHERQTSHPIQNIM